MPTEPLDVLAANRHGQQLFLADMFTNRARLPETPAVAALTEPAAPKRRAGLQLPLFEMARDLRRRGYSIAGLADRADPVTAAHLDGIIAEHAAHHGWRSDMTWEVRTGVRILIGFQDVPGTPITASDVAALGGTGIPLRRVLDVLNQAGLLHDDRTPAITAWFDHQTEGLPKPMEAELRRWFEIMLHGSRTPPRRHPRTQITIRLHLSWALPALHAWAQAGRVSLREVTSADVKAALPASGNPRATMGQGLRSILRLLKAHKVTFTNPIAQIKTGYAQPREPLPLAPALLREGLNSPDPSRAALIALVAFHGLRTADLRTLQLSDLHDARLHIGGRTIVLADPVRQRLRTYLDYRARQWPNTANAHLFIHFKTAPATEPVGNRWIKLKIDILGGAQALREDRLLHEAHATGGDIRRICDMFGLSVQAATRYAATLDHPDLANPQPASGTQGGPHGNR